MHEREGICTATLKHSQHDFSERLIVEDEMVDKDLGIILLGCLSYSFNHIMTTRN